jgi:hypothetical protein
MRPCATSTIEPTATLTMLCRKLPAVISNSHSRPPGARRHTAALTSRTQL